MSDQVRLAEQLRIETLGGLSIWLDRRGGAANDDKAQRLHFDARSAEALLVYLACQGRALARDTLAELFWPDRSQEQARTNLRGCLHRLRQQLGAYLLVTRQSVALDFDAPVTVDSLELEAYCAQGDCATAAALYKADFLDGFYMDGSPAFEQWALLERERLRNLVISACHQLVNQATANGQLELAIGYCERLLYLDPLHEPIHRQLMRLLAQAGRRTAALAQYAACCQILDKELGVPPDETTTALYAQIRVGALDKEQWGANNPQPSILVEFPAATTLPHNNIPAQSTPFVGREVELTQIGDLLSNPDCRLVSLLGLGGIGKSRLAIEAARRKAGAFASGVCFVALAPLVTADFVLVAIAQSLGLQTISGDLRAQVLAYLQSRTLLLVLDNFEHLPGATATVADLLHSAPGVKFLVTSRERLYLREEWLLPIAGLAVAEGAAGEAGQLFLRSARQVLPGFVANEHEAAIAAICRQVEGMPLALELAASWVRVMPCEEIARQITHNPELLASSVRNLPERHRSLHSLFDHSWRLLTPAEQHVLRRVSAFQGGWMLEEAVLVADATWSLLAALVDKSLVRMDQPGRFGLHELVQQYATGQLSTSGEADWVHERHFAAYLKLARAADRQLRGPTVAGGYAQLAVEQDNVRTALQWALASGRFVDAAWLCIALSHFWSVRGPWQEARRWLEQLLPHRQQLPADLRLAMFLSLYHFWRGQEAFQLIDQYMSELVQLQANCTDKILCAVTWRTIAVAAGDFAQAAAAWERCIPLLSEARRAPPTDENYCIYADSVYQHAFALFRYAIRLTDVGEYVQAERLSTESLILFRRLDNRDSIMLPLGNLGRLALLRGDLAQARLLLQEAVTNAANMGNKLGLLDWQPRLGIVTLYSGDATAARRLLSESLLVSLELNSKLYSALILTYLAETALWEGEADQAAQWLAQALAYHANPRWVRTELVDSLWIAARLATVQQDYPRAATLFGLAEQVSSQIRYALVEPVRAQVDAALATVRDALDPAVFAAAFNAGKQLSLAEAFATALLLVESG